MCRSGHWFTEANIYWEYRVRRGKLYIFRRCRACALASNKEYDVFRRDYDRVPKKKRDKGDGRVAQG